MYPMTTSTITVPVMCGAISPEMAMAIGSQQQRKSRSEYGRSQSGG